MTSSIAVAVIGTGIIGRTLAARFAEAGHTVVIGTRDPGRAEVAELAQQTGARLASIEDAIDASDAVVWAINGAAMAEAVPAHGPRLGGKVVIDATNSVGAAVMNSLELLGAHAPDARLYRAFNSLGWENFADPHYGDIVGDLLYCGPAGAGAEVAESLIQATGLRPIRVGDTDAVGIVDSMAYLWFALAFGQGMGRGVGFKILTR
ncbi:NADPH-dependent F420 reductase [Leifsonia sp. EB34]|uniref:NADPH-dependent F420 reductase n=1 Tax=Leifsonia sp. EB34 TaxID=3156303 RepID=UPI00351595EC